MALSVIISDQLIWHGMCSIGGRPAAAKEQLQAVESETMLNHQKPDGRHFAIAGMNLNWCIILNYYLLIMIIATTNHY